MPGRSYTYEELAEAVRAARTYTDVLRELGLRVAGGNHASIRRAVERAGLDVTHFRRPDPRPRTLRPLSEVLVRGSTYSRHLLKRRLFTGGLKQRRCELCGQGEEWRGGRMSLILDHVNGEHDDNRLENLRIVCPNCNATLDTHCGRRSTRADDPRPCDFCATTFSPQRHTQRFCSRACAGRGRHYPRARPELRRVQRPPEAQLRAEIDAQGFLAVGRRYGVSDNAIRKWLRTYEREREPTGRPEPAGPPAPDEPGGATNSSRPAGPAGPVRGTGLDARARVATMSATTDDDQLFGDEHVRVYRETGGQRGFHWRGTEILLLTTTGRRSGEARTMALIMRTDGPDRWVIVASKGGAPEHPAWFLNLQADPEITIEVMDETIPVRPSVAEGEERARLWTHMTEVWPAYDDYQAKTDREIPIVVLERR